MDPLPLVVELLRVEVGDVVGAAEVAQAAETLSDAQLDYAASDVLYLHRLRAALDDRLQRENRTDMAQACFEFLPTRAWLDLAGWPETDIFAHA